MEIAVSVLAAGIGAVILIIRHRQPPLVIAHHICVDLVYVRGMGEVHHIRRVASGRPHIDLKRHKVSFFAKTLVGFRQTEELQMDETPADVERVRRRGDFYFGVNGAIGDWMEVYPNAEFVNLYGPTEVTCNSSYYRIDRDNMVEGKLPAGRTFPGKIVNLINDAGEMIPVDSEETVGEICVSGDELALGYYNNPEVTGAAFVQMKLSDGNVVRTYKTGDLGYWKDGLLYFAGRKDFQIKHNGHRIELEEIERALNSLPELQQACCIYDEERYRIIAFCTGSNDKKAIVEGLKKILPEYMLPNIYKFMDELPLTKNGKIDRNNLRELMGTRK